MTATESRVPLSENVRAVLVTGAGLIGTLVACAVERSGDRAVLLDIAPREPAIRELGFRGRVAVEEFVDARDCADAAIAALQAPSPSQVVFNIARPAAVTHEDLVGAVRRHFPDLEVQIACGHERGFAGYPKPRPAISDVSAARRELGFQTKRSLQESVDWIIEVERRRAGKKGASPGNFDI